MLVMRPGVRGVRIDELAFSPDAQALAAPALSGGVMLWAAFADGARPEVVPLPNQAGASRLAFAPDGSTLFAGHDQLFALDLASREATRVPTGRWSTLGFAVSPDGAALVVSEFLQGGETTRLTCWSTDDFTAHEWQIEIAAHVYLPPVVHKSGNAFVQIESIRQPVNRHWRTHRVRRSLKTGEHLDKTPPLPDSPEQLALSPDGATVAVRVRESLHIGPAVGRDDVTRAVPNTTKKHFTGVAFHPSGRHLAATSNDETVKLFDTTTWELARTFTWDIGRMRSVCFSPDGTLAAAGSDKGKVVVWDVDE
jgi:WD40 repeat protein